jgi:hypothetical protein
MNSGQGEMELSVAYRTLSSALRSALDGQKNVSRQSGKRAYEVNDASLGKGSKGLRVQSMRISESLLCMTSTNELCTTSM